MSTTLFSVGLVLGTKLYSKKMPLFRSFALQIALRLVEVVGTVAIAFNTTSMIKAITLLCQGSISNWQ